MISKSSRQIKVFLLILETVLSVFLAGCIGSVKGSLQSLTPVSEGLRFEESFIQTLPNKQIQLVGKSGVQPYTFEILAGPGTLNSESGEFQSTEVGISTVRLVDKVGKWAIGSVQILEPVQLISSYSEIGIKNKLQLAAKGGKEPYTFSSTSGSITSDGVFEAAESSGAVTITVEDSLGSISSLQLQVKQAIGFVNPQVSVGAGQTVNLPINSDLTVGKVIYEVVAGEGSVDPITGAYKAGTSNGTSIVKVEDDLGNKAFEVITINGGTDGPLTMLPINAVAAPSGKTYFAISGGTAPYSFEVLSGGGSFAYLNESTLKSAIEFTAPSFSTSVVVKATDAVGASTTGLVLVTSVLEANPRSHTLAVGSSAFINVTGGMGPYNFSTTYGVIDPVSGRFTAPLSAGLSSVKVVDQSGQSVLVPISIKQGLLIAPSDFTMPSNSEAVVSAIGGVSPYKFSIKSGSGEIKETENGSSIIFKSTDVLGSVVIEVSDAKNDKVTSNIRIVGDFRVNPYSATVTAGRSQEFIIEGGVPPYTFNFGNPNSQGSLEQVSENSFRFIAPQNVTNSTLQNIAILDSAGNAITANIMLNASASILDLSESLVLGQANVIRISGGLQPFTLTSSDSSIVRITKLDNERFELNGIAIGSAQITLTDATQVPITKSIGVSAVLSATPSVAQLQAGESKSFSFSGGIRPLQSAVVRFGRGTISSFGENGMTYTAPSNASSTGESAVVRVLDKQGNYFDIQVTSVGSGSSGNTGVDTGLPFSGPSQPVKLAVFNSKNLSSLVSGGFTPYTYSIAGGGVGGSIGATSGVYIAPSVSGTDNVKVRDANGTELIISVQIQSALQISPATATLMTGKSTIFGANGGVAPYTFAVVSTNGGTIGLTTGSYLAPSLAGTYQVKAVDSLGNESTATLTVTPGPSRLNLTTISNTVAAQCSGSIRLSLRDENGTAVVDSIEHIATFNLGSLSPLIYSASDCSGSAINQITLPADANYVEFYFKSSKAEVFTLTANSSGLQSATQMFTVVPSDASQIVAAGMTNTMVIGSCLAVNFQLKDNFSNFVGPLNPVAINALLNKLSFHSLVDCSDTNMTNFSISSISGKTVYVKGIALGAATAQMTSSGLLGLNLNTTVQSAPPTSLVFSQNPSTSAIGDTDLATQPIVEARDAGGGVVPDFSGAVTLSAFSENTCINPASGNLMATANPLNATNGIASFSGLKYQGDGVIYLKATIASASSNCFGPVTITPNYNSSIISSPQFAPSDGNAIAPIRIVPRLSGLNLGSGKVVQLRSSRTDLIYSAGSACSGHQCALDLGNGSYQFLVKAPTNIAGTSNFTVYLSPGTAEEAQIGSFAINFDTNNFTVYSTTATVTSADAGKNLYILGGVITFNSTTVGQTFGDIFVRAGTISPSASTTTTYTPLDFTVRSLNMDAGAINATGFGYYINRTYGATGPYTPGAYGNSYGASHIGLGGPHTNGAVPLAYDNFKDPKFPGGGGSTTRTGWVIGDGGGVIKIFSQNDCYINGTATVKSEGTAGGAAGGTINFKCKGFAGTPAANAISAVGANGGWGASGWDYMGGGSGGAVSLQTTGGAESFNQAFKYPNSGSDVNALKSIIRVYGGKSTLEGGGASWANGGGGGSGTLYMKHSGLLYGSLIMENNNFHFAPKTSYMSFATFNGTVSSIQDSRNLVLTLDNPLAAHQVDIYKGLTVRFVDSKFNNGTPNDISDDLMAVIVGHSPSTFEFDRDINNVAIGDKVRVAYVVDHIDLGSGVVMSPNFDLIVNKGSFGRNDKRVDLTNAFICNSNNGIFAPQISALTITASTYYFANRNCNSQYVGSLTVEGGTISDLTYLNVNSANLTGGSTSIYDFNVDTSLFLGGSATLNGLNINVGSDFVMNSGTLKQIATTSTQINRLNLNVDGNFSMTGGSIDLNSLGFPNYYSYGDNVPSTAFQGNVNFGPGGSHLGRGGFTAFSSPPVYDKFWDPDLPGSGGPTSYGCQTWVNGIGGGVFKLNTVGSCTITGASTIKANGGIGGAAGGTISLKCASFNGTLAANSITANGGNGAQNAAGCDAMAAGGGGAIAIISGGAAASLQGSFKYPTNSSEITTTKSIFNAYGGNPMPNYGGGGAGTVYFKHSGLEYGSLIIDNGTKASMGANTRHTEIPGFAATIGSTANAQTLNLAFATPLTANHNNIFKGIKVRVPADIDNGTPDNFSDDQLFDIVSHTDTAFTFNSNLPVVANGKPVRSVVLLDHLEVSGGSILVSDSDVYVKSGSFVSTDGKLNFNNGLVLLNGDAKLSPQIELLRLTNAPFFSSASPNTSFNNVKDISIEGGTIYLGAINVRNFTISGGTLVTSGISTALDFTMSGTPTLTTESINVGRNYLMSSGTIKHPPGTATKMNRLFIDVVGTFTMNGGTIDTDGAGYLNKYSYGDLIPSTTIGSTGNTAAAGGSHLGIGGGDTNGNPGLGFDDYRDPKFPGGGAGVNAGCYYGDSNGGGVIHVAAQGACTFSGSSVLKADGGGMGGSGGSISLRCYSIGGTIGSASIIARGDNGVGGGSGCDHVGSGGGGAIAIVATGPAGSLTGSFIVPANATEINNLRDKVRSHGGVGINTGGAGTIFMKHAGLNHGVLIVDNNNNAITAKIGTTKIRGTNANSNLINSKLGDDSLGLGLGNPFSGIENYFSQLKLHVFDSTYLDPLITSRYQAVLTGNGPSTFLSAPNGFASLGSISNNKEYRFVHYLDSLYVDRNATLDLNGADLVMDPSDGQACDLINSRSGGAVGYLSVPSSGKVIGNVYSSVKCPHNNLSTKGTNVLFNQYCDGGGVCSP